MKRMLIITTAVFAVLAAAIAFAAVKGGKLELKEGDVVYACNCGEKCPCNTISRNPGKCTCGTDMVKATVIKVEDGKAMLKGEGWEKEREFTTIGKYICACGPKCNCDTISQNPGKCNCGAEMKRVKKK